MLLGYHHLLFVLFLAVLPPCLLTSGFAEEATPQERYDVYPQNMWTSDDLDVVGYTRPERIRRVLRSHNKERPWHQEVVIDAASLDDLYGFFAREKIGRLQVVGATNQTLRRLSQLESLRILRLPCCQADDFRPLAKLNLYCLSLSNPNLPQLRQEQLLRRMTSLSSLTLYGIEDLQAALELPGLKPGSSYSVAGDGLFTLIIQAPHWNPASRVTWPEQLERLPEFCILADRVRFGYVQRQRATIWLGRYANDDPAICSTRLRDVIERSGFYDDRRVVNLDLVSQHRVRHDARPSTLVFDKTDVSPLAAFENLRYMTVTGSFYGYENLDELPLEWIVFTESSPSPTKEVLEVLNRHPTLKKVEKVVYSATRKDLLQKQDKSQ